MKSTDLQRHRALGNIPAGRGTWAVDVRVGDNGEVVNVLVVLEHPTKDMLRVVEVGWIDDGRGNTYDGLRYWERGGGGVVTLPYVIMNGVLYVGVVTQHRVHAGGEIENAPRGYLKGGTTNRDENAVAELAEEVGPHCARLSVPFRLPGDPVNMNTAVFWTPDPNEGNTFHAVEVNPEDLQECGDNLEFRSGVFAPEGGESIIRCRFVRWQRAVRNRDGLTQVAVLRLLDHLQANNRLTMAFD